MKIDGSADATRERLAELLLREGALTAAHLAERLALSTQGIRRHLAGLLADGLIDERPSRATGRGRPSREYALTDKGRSTFGEDYDSLAVQALEFLHRSGGEPALKEFAEARVSVVEARFDALLASNPELGPARALAQALNDEGYVASVVDSPTGEQVCQHHCPVAHVAQRFPQLCRAETSAFERMMGQHVQRLATIAHGDTLCTTHIPHTQPQENR